MPTPSRRRRPDGYAAIGTRHARSSPGGRVTQRVLREGPEELVSRFSPYCEENVERVAVAERATRHRSPHGSHRLLGALGIAILAVGVACDANSGHGDETATLDSISSIDDKVEPELEGPSFSECAEEPVGFDACCEFDNASHTWRFSSSPCRDSTNCSLLVDCQPGYAERARTSHYCDCFSVASGDKGISGCFPGEGCRGPEYYRVDYRAEECACEPLGVGACAPEDEGPGVMWDGYRGVCSIASGLYAYECAQEYDATGRASQVFCSTCPCPTHDKVVPIRSALEEQLETLNACFFYQDTIDDCCIYSDEFDSWTHVDTACPDAEDCSPTYDCPPGYAERMDGDGDCFCHAFPSETAGTGRVSAVLAEVNADMECPAAAGVTHIFRCQAAIPDNGTAFCATVPCPFVARDLPLEK